MKHIMRFENYNNKVNEKILFGLKRYNENILTEVEEMLLEIEDDSNSVYIKGLVDYLIEIEIEPNIDFKSIDILKYRNNIEMVDSYLNENKFFIVYIGVYHTLRCEQCGDVVDPNDEICPNCESYIDPDAGEYKTYSKLDDLYEILKRGDDIYNIIIHYKKK